MGSRNTLARLLRLKQAKKRDPWAMTDGDIAIYDKAFVKLDKDKDGFISLPGRARRSGEVASIF